MENRIASFSPGSVELELPIFLDQLFDLLDFPSLDHVSHVVPLV